MVLELFHFCVRSKLSMEKLVIANRNSDIRAYLNFLLFS